MNKLRSELDVREKRAGIRALNNEFKPLPYNRKDKRGNIVAQESRAETAAQHLAYEQWGNTENCNETFNNTNIIDPTVENNNKYNTGIITLAELEAIINKLKRHKAPGPDGLTTEIFKEMNTENKKLILDLIYDWWITEKIPEEVMLAD